MITTQTMRTFLPMKMAQPARSQDGLSQLLAAAVVNHQFRNMLLQDPVTALRSGYLGENFSLTSEERRRIVSIQADSLSDLARQLTNTTMEKRH
jgi:hypothetical protein